MNDYERNFGEEKSSLIKLVDMLSVLTMIATGVYTLIMWPGIPSRIATHFDGQGMVDGYGGKWVLVMMLLLMLVLYGSMFLIAKFPNLYNYPVKITESNKAVQFNLVTKFLHVIMLESILLVAFIQVGTVRNAFNSEQNLNVVVLWGLMALMLISIIVYFIKAIQNK